MTLRNLLAIALLVISASPTYAVRNLAGNQYMNAVGKTNSSAFFCPSLCVPCAYGDRTIFLARSKGVTKTVLDIGVVSLALSGVGSLWGFVAGAVGFGSYAVGDHLWAQELGNECPYFQIRYFNGDEYEVAPPDVERLINDADKSPMYLFKKSLSKLFKLETGESRKTGQIPPSLKTMIDKADFLCGQNGGAVHIRMKEEGGFTGAHSWLTKSFQRQCKALHDNYHDATEGLDEMEVADPSVTEIEDDAFDPLQAGDIENNIEDEFEGGEIEDTPAFGISEDPVDVIDDHFDEEFDPQDPGGKKDPNGDIVTKPTGPQETPASITEDTPAFVISEDPVDVIDDHFDEEFDPQDPGGKKDPKGDIVTKPTGPQETIVTKPEAKDEFVPKPTGQQDTIVSKPTGPGGNADVVVVRKDPSNLGPVDLEDDEQTYYLDNHDPDVQDEIANINSHRSKLITIDTASSSICRLMRVGAWGCKLVRADGICACKYMAPQTCDTWFRGDTTLRPIVKSSGGMLLMAKDLCECYGTKGSYGCSFGVLDHVPNIALKKEA